MPAMLSELRDIEGLDAIPSAFPAINEWVLAILALALVVFGLIALGIWAWKYRLTEYWRRDAYYQLKELSRQAKQQGDTPELARQFSSLLRRIVMALYGREACAGLTDQAWLQWLQQRDPKAFNWQDYAPLLLHLPYQERSNNHTDATGQRRLRTLIKATLAWLYCYPPTAQPQKPPAESK